MDGSGTLDASDVRLVLQILVGLVSPTLHQRDAGDVDRDGTLTLRDMVLMLRRVGGLIAEFPTEAEGPPPPSQPSVATLNLVGPRSQHTQASAGDEITLRVDGQGIGGLCRAEFVADLTRRSARAPLLIPRPGPEGVQVQLGDVFTLPGASIATIRALEIEPGRILVTVAYSNDATPARDRGSLVSIPLTVAPEAPLAATYLARLDEPTVSLETGAGPIAVAGLGTLVVTVEDTP